MAQVASQQKQQNDTFTQEYQHNYEILKQSYEDLTKRYFNLSKDVPLLEINLKNVTREFKELQTVNEQLKENHEREVCMRVVFEEKLNMCNASQIQMQSAMEMMTKEYANTNNQMADVLGDNRNQILINKTLKSEHNSLTSSVTVLIQEKKTLQNLYNQAKDAIIEFNQKEDD